MLSHDAVEFFSNLLSKEVDHSVDATTDWLLQSVPQPETELHS